MRRAAGWLCTFVTLAATLPVGAQSPAPPADMTRAFDGRYVGVSAENNSRGNTLAGRRTKAMAEPEAARPFALRLN
jgi:hypothetical protein